MNIRTAPSLPEPNCYEADANTPVAPFARDWELYIYVRVQIKSSVRFQILQVEIKFEIFTRRYQNCDLGR